LPDDERVTALPLPKETVASPGTAGNAQTFAAGTELSDHWWTAFGVPALDGLVTRALTANPSIRAAQSSLAAARELALAGRGGWWPSIDAGIEAGRQRINLAATGDAAAHGVYNTFGARVSASYAPDFFGRQRRLVESLDADQAFAAENLRAAHLAVAAGVVTTAITLASIEAQIEATEALVATERDALTLVRKRLDLGHASMLEVLSQQAELDQTLATLPPLRAQWQRTRNALAVLVGETPGRFSTPPLAFATLKLPPELPVSLPAAILARRPDVRAEEALVHAASARVGIATASLLPQITLTASAGGQANAASDVTRGAYSVWGLGGSLIQPILRGGELRHRRRAAVHEYEASVASYDATVLGALANVSDVLTAIVEDAELTQVAVDGADTANRALSLAERSFAAGGTSYLQLLSTEQSAERARLGAVLAQSARLTDTVALYQALGGAW
jgi:NodT family efflux transporter outer membrane factor (OMF) lipoprotein